MASCPDASADVPPGTDPGGNRQHGSSRMPDPRSPAVPSFVGRGKILWQLLHTHCNAGSSVLHESEDLDLSDVVAADADGPFDASDVLECDSYNLATDSDEEKRVHAAPQHDPATSPDDIVSNSNTLLGQCEDHLKNFSANLVCALGARFEAALSEPGSDDDDFQARPFKRAAHKKQVTRTIVPASSLLFLARARTLCVARTLLAFCSQSLYSIVHPSS